MITKWKLGNFRSIRDNTVLDFAPLTFFAGANSSGKSTILKSILLIAQTLSQKDPSRPVVLNGDLIKLGNFSDNISDNSTSNQLVIGWECVPFNDTLVHVDEILKKKNGQYTSIPESIHCEIAVAPSDSESHLPTGHYGVIDLYRSHLAAGHSSLNVRRSDIHTIGTKKKWVNATWDKDIRNGLSYVIEDGESHVYDEFDFILLPPNTLKEEYTRTDIGYIFQNFLPVQIVIGEEWTDKSDNMHLRVFKRSLSSEYEAATQYITHFFSKSLHYLGPLRASSKSLYARFSNSVENSIGLKGENTPEVLERHKGKIIRYISSSSFATPGNISESFECSLLDAVVDWLGYLGIADTIETIDKGKYGLELGVRIRNSNKINDLTQVGVGVSQVLPILVSCLLAEPDSTLIFEQPELHLHPKVQSRLADFFLSITQIGKQCLVETHSEHIINRIRLRIAEGSEGSPWHDAAKVYFVENKNDSSTFREIKIDECGSILVWPEGFFDERQQETERILRAASQKDVKNWKDN